MLKKIIILVLAVLVLIVLGISFAVDTSKLSAGCCENQRGRDGSSQAVDR